MASRVFLILIIAAIWGAVRSQNLNLNNTAPVFAAVVFFFAVTILYLFLHKKLRGKIYPSLARAANFVSHNQKKLAILIIGITICGQIIVLLNLATAVGWDVNEIIRLAQGIFVGNETDNYLQYYNNNLFYFFLMKGYSTLLPSFLTDQWISWNALGAISADIGILLAALAARRKFGGSAFLFTWLLGTATIALSPWILIPYTDLLVWPFVSGSLLVLARYDEKGPRKKQVLWGILFAALIAGSFFMKASAATLFPAFLICSIVWILNLWKSHPRPSSIPHVSAISFICCLILFIFVWNVFLTKQTVVELNPEKRMPITHFLMMGMRMTEEGYYGGYSFQDVESSMNQKTYDERVAFNEQVIKERLAAFGAPGYIQFLLHKYEANTQDGTFFWGGEGASGRGFLTGARPLVHDSFIQNLLKNLFYPDGAYLTVYRFVAQFWWIALLCLAAFSAASTHLRRYTTILQLAFVLGLVFLLFFEAGRSRYMIQYLPILLILGASGLKTCWAKISRWQIDDTLRTR